MEKFEEDLEKLKNKINSMSLSDEFKDNLSKKLDMEYNKPITKRHFTLPKQIVAVFACCILITSCVFADSIGNVITNFFANTSKEMEQAIESGELQYLEMDYVERDGISIKVDYAMVKDNSIYLVFNVLCEEEITELRFIEYEISDENKDIIYKNLDLNYNYYNAYVDYDIKRLNEKNIVLFIELSNIKNIENLRNLTFLLNKIWINAKDNVKYIDNNWSFNIDINK